MKTILLVDDEYALVECLTELLQEEGYRVASAANGKDGLVRLQEEHPHLVITDLMMPITDGRGLLRGMRTIPEFQSTPVIMISSTNKSVALSTADGPLEVSAFLRKPFHWDQLIQKVVQLIGRASAQKVPPAP